MRARTIGVDVFHISPILLQHLQGTPSQLVFLLQPFNAVKMMINPSNFVRSHTCVQVPNPHCTDGHIPPTHIMDLGTLQDPGDEVVSAATLGYGTDSTWYHLLGLGCFDSSIVTKNVGLVFSTLVGCLYFKQN